MVPLLLRPPALVDAAACLRPPSGAESLACVGRLAAVGCRGGRVGVWDMVASRWVAGVDCGGAARGQDDAAVCSVAVTASRGGRGCGGGCTVYATVGSTLMAWQVHD